MLGIIFQQHFEFIEALGPLFHRGVIAIAEVAAGHLRVSSKIGGGLTGDDSEASSDEQNFLRRRLLLYFDFRLLNAIGEDAYEDEFEHQRDADQDETYLRYLQVQAHDTLCHAGLGLLHSGACIRGMHPGPTSEACVLGFQPGLAYLACNRGLHLVCQLPLDFQQSRVKRR